MKYNYLKDHLCLNIQDETLFHAFVKVYTYFDIELEKAVAIRAIYLLNLNSFLDFRLYSIKQKWQQMCNLTNVNAELFVKSETFLDILKFLISNLDYKIKEITIDFGCGKIIAGKDELFFAVNDDLMVLTKIIELAPKKIKVLNLNDEEIKNVLTDLFQNRMEIIKN